MSTIHPRAIVSPLAKLGPNVVVGPFSVVEEDVEIGPGCQLASHVVVKSGTRLGPENVVCESAVLGGLPQHLSIPERPGTLILGRANVIREFCTLHRSLYEGQATQVGDHNLLMVGAHVAHDCHVGNHVVLTNSVALAGHVTVQDRAYLGGGVGVHQFCRVGQLAMIGGHARVLKDVLPFVTLDGGSGLVVGLNSIGLRRAGYTAEDIKQLKAAYRMIYRAGLSWREIVPALATKFPSGPAADFHHFLSGGTRGFTQERRTPPGATVRLHPDTANDPSSTRKAS